MCSNCEFALTEDDLRFEMKSWRKRDLISFGLRWQKMAVEREHRIKELERRPSCAESWGECDCE